MNNDSKKLEEFIQANDLLGKPFEYDGVGPDSFNCYSFLRYCYKNHFEKEIPDYKNPKKPAEIGVVAGQVVANDWQKTDRDFSGAMLLYRMPFGGTHVGVSFGNGKFVHVWERSNGVCTERRNDWANRLLGIYKLKDDD